MNSVTHYRRRLVAGTMSLLMFWSVLAAMLPAAAVSAAPGASARLAGLTLSAGSLSTAFDPEQTAYTAAVADNYGELSVVPTAEDEAATIAVSINGEDAVPVASGAASPPLALEIGSNVVKIKVVSGDGALERAYTIGIAKSAVVLQQGIGYTGQKDVHVSEGTHRDKNTGAHNAIEVGYFDPIMTDRKWGLFQFDLSPIPSGAVLTEAELGLYLTGTRVRGSGERLDKTLHLHPVTGEWEEGTGTGFDGTEGAPGVIWNTRPGFDENVTLDSQLVGTAPNRWYAWDLTALSQQWLDGSADNYGVLLKETDSASNEETIPSTKNFASAQNGNAALRPKLALNYTLPLTGVRLDSEPLDLIAGQPAVSLANKAFVRPLNAALTGPLQWTSGDETVASVDASGTVTPAGAGATEITVAASGPAGTFSASVAVTVAELDTRGLLAGLSVNGAVLGPEFNPAVSEYEVHVPLNARQVTVTPVAYESDAIITLTTESDHAQTVASGSPGLPVPLSPDATRIRIQVEPAGAGDEQAGEYFITVRYRETGGAGDAIIREFLNPNGRVLVVAHRGNWLNGLPENGLDSIRESIEEGVDMVELDIRTTRDGVPVLMHDGSVNRTTNGSGNVSSLTLAQIKQLCLRNSDGTISNPCERVPTLEEAMELARGQIMVNLDIKNADWDTMWDILVRTDTTDHALYKTSAGKASTAAWMAQFKDSAVQPLFMQLTSNPETALDFMNPATTPFTVHAFEISFTDDNAPIVDPALIRQLHELGARVWVNTIFSVPGLVGRHGDYAFLSDPNAGFPWLLDRGIDMIQTDTTALLLQYLKERGNAPSSGMTQTAVFQQGLEGYAGAADTHVVELPANNRNRNNFGGSAQINIGPQNPVLSIMDGNINGKIASLTATGSSPDNEGKENLIDFALNTKWLVRHNQSDVTFALTEPTVVRGYALSSANDSPGRDPKEWTFEGSVDGSSWDILDERVDQAFGDRFQTRSYRNIANDTAYAQYRFRFTANHGDSYLQLAQIQLSDGSSHKPESPIGQDRRYGLLRFDLSGIPDGAQVTSARLGLYLVDAGSSDDSPYNTVYVHQILEPWKAGSGTGNNGSAVPEGQRWATWETKPEFLPAASTVASIGKQLYNWKEIEVGPLVKGWLENPAANFGLLLDSPGISMSFASSDNAVQAWRPKLEVTYAIPAGGVSVTPSELALEAGEQSRLVATVLPDNALNRRVTWHSDNETVARVDDTGLVMAISPGNAVITATTATGGHTATVPVAVTRSGASAYLGGLQLSAGSLTEEFQPAKTAYIASVPEVYNHLAITPHAEDDAAEIEITVNGDRLATVASGQQSAPFVLEIGDNRIDMKVVSGAAVQTYSIIVPKAAVALQEGVGGYEGTADTQLSKGTGSTGNRYYQYNMGAQYGFEVGYYNQNTSDEKYGLVRFDDIPVPDGAIISEASLNLYHYGQRSANRAIDIYAHKANAPWMEGRGGSGESNDGSPAEPGEATWESYITNGSNPFEPAAADQVNVDAYPQWYAFDIPSIVQEWIDAPDRNYGVVLKPYTYPDSSDPTMTGTKRFRTKEFTDPALRPVLRIVYSMPASGITLDRSELELTAGGSGGKLEAMVRPLNAVDRTVVWSSDNEQVAIVDANGHVTAVSAGTATIAAANANGDTAYATVVVRQVGTAAELADLSLSAGQLSPDFASGHYAYTAMIPAGVSSIRITPSAVDDNATITVRSSSAGEEPQQVASGSASLPIAVRDGAGIAIEVVSEDGLTTRTYNMTLAVQSGLGDLRLSTGSLSPAFAWNRYLYTVQVASGTSAITLQPYALHEGDIAITAPGGTVQTVASGAVSAPIALQTGINIITLETAAVAGTDQATYTIVVDRPSAAGGSGNPGGPPPAAPTAEIVRLGNELAVTIPQEQTGLTLALGKLGEAETVDLAPHDLLSAVYTVELGAGQRLSKPLLLAIAYDPSKLKGGRASVFRLNEDGVWVELGGAVRDGIITAATNETGMFAVYGLAAAEPPVAEQPGQPEQPEPPVAVWPDVRNHWAESALRETALKGIIAGYPDGSMKPDERVTRAQFSTMLVRALGLSEASDLSGFADYADMPEWAKASMSAAVSAGIISGYPDGTLRPNQWIDRAEMVTMLMRAYRMETEAPMRTVFKDEDAIPEWAEAAVYQAAELGVVVGKQGEFKPADTATRAEAAVVILSISHLQAADE